jgi:hypothetical protein
MRRRLYKWDPRPPTVRERVIAGIWLLAFAIAQASYIAGWRLFGDYDKLVSAALVIVGVVLVARLATVKRA